MQVAGLGAAPAPSPVTEPYNLQCGHTFCTDCIAEWCARAPRRLGGPPCPLCRRDISVNDTSRLRMWKLIFATKKDIKTYVSDVTSDY